jgi:hypothetical protein
MTGRPAEQLRLGLGRADQLRMDPSTPALVELADAWPKAASEGPSLVEAEAVRDNGRFYAWLSASMLVVILVVVIVARIHLPA